jgi:zinc protease
MKKFSLLSTITLFFVIVFLIPFFANAQLKTTTSAGYEYSYVDNDPLNARIYKLSNGLTVYLSVNKTEPRIHTFIAVKAGSKNDPADATGQAHYFEHIMFKGTKNFGTKDYESEKYYLDKISDLFEIYRTKTDTTERKSIYHIIDSLSYLASGFAIANEYGKMLNEIGAKWTNAWTSKEETVFMNDIPSNVVEKWLNIEYDRFKNPVFRLFHTELEVVYEEKNKYEDYGDTKAYDELFSLLFKKHQYGTQTIIGTTQHLKNPSIKKLNDYYNTYYVPNNMAICLAGDFDPDETIKMIDKTFGTLPSKTVPVFNPAAEEPVEKILTKDVTSPDEEFILLGFRFNGVNSEDVKMLTILNEILSNYNKAGLIDLNLVKSQKVLDAYSYPHILKDYSVHIFSAQPKQGQSLEELKDLILGQINLIKEGKFDDWYFEAVINNYKYREIKSYENNYMRAYTFVYSFTNDVPWDKILKEKDELSKITKEEIISFVQKNYNDNYAVVYKRTGKNEEGKKITKPEITPVNLNREFESEFYKKNNEQKINEIQPVFVDFKKDITISSLKNNIPIYYKENTENKTFDLYFHFDMGKNNEIKLFAAVQYLQYLGSSKHSAKEFEQELYKLGGFFYVYPSNEEVRIYIGGFSENFEKALQLLEERISDPVSDEKALKNLIADIRKERANEKLNKDNILWDGLYNYGLYGPVNPFRNRIKDEDLDKIKASELIEIIKNLFSFEHKILYYGSDKVENVVDILNKYHNASEKLKPPLPEIKFVEKQNEKNQVYFVNYDMKEVEIILVSRGEMFKLDLLPEIKIYNEYFGGKMSSIVFTELRESQALTYGASGRYIIPAKKDKYCSIRMYIGTQWDKLNEALSGMMKLLNNDLPKTDVLFDNAKTGILNSYRTERKNRTDILFDYINSLRYGVDYDLRKDVYEKVQNASFDDVYNFQEKYVKGRKYNILVLGDKNKVDFKVLKKFGDVKELTLEEIFGF